MGTNFYWRETDEQVCPCCGRVNESLHIGKSSIGWAFQLNIIFESKEEANICYLLAATFNH